MTHIDLHTHTTFSDGTLTPSELVCFAEKIGLTAIAITDHDSVAALPIALQKVRNLKIKLITGIEISAAYPQGFKNNTGTIILSPKHAIHILGYKIDFNNLYLEEKIEQLKQSRNKRNQKIINKLQELGFNICLEEVQQESKGQIVGRLHIANVLSQKGYFPSAKEAFKRYLGDNGLAYFSKEIFTPQEAIEIITRAGGIPCLAHPWLIKRKLSLKELEAIIDDLIKSGLKGIESYYPLYTKQQQECLLSLAKTKNLIVVGGSDFHGKNKDIQLGQAQVPEDILEQL